MTPQQALELLDNVIARMPLTREDHVRVQQAVQVLAKAIGDKTNKQPIKEADDG